VAIDNLNRENTMSIMYGSHHFHSSDARDKERNESKVRCWCRSIYRVLFWRRTISFWKKSSLQHSFRGKRTCDTTPTIWVELKQS
jgi:hypothetical protein